MAKGFNESYYYLTNNQGGRTSYKVDSQNINITNRMTKRIQGSQMRDIWNGVDKILYRGHPYLTEWDYGYLTTFPPTDAAKINDDSGYVQAWRGMNDTYNRNPGLTVKRHATGSTNNFSSGHKVVGSDVMNLFEDMKDIRCVGYYMNHASSQYWYENEWQNVTTGDLPSYISPQKNGFKMRKGYWYDENMQRKDWSMLEFPSSAHRFMDVDMTYIDEFKLYMSVGGYRSNGWSSSENQGWHCLIDAAPYATYTSIQGGKFYQITLDKLGTFAAQYLSDCPDPQASGTNWAWENINVDFILVGRLSEDRCKWWDD